MSGLVFGLVLGMFFIVSGVSGVQKGVYVSERPDEGTGLYSPYRELGQTPGGVLPPNNAALPKAPLGVDFKLCPANDSLIGGAQRDFTILGSSVMTQIAISL